MKIKEIYNERIFFNVIVYTDVLFNFVLLMMYK